MQAHCQLADPIPSLSPFSSNNDMADNQSKDNMLSKTVRVAVTQAEPEWLDLNASVKKTCSLIEEAAGQGAKLISFPECWIPGYPAWVWFAEWFSIHKDLSADMSTRSRPLDPALTRRYMQNSLATKSAQMQLIQDSARKNKITVALGYSENDHNSLYISQATISDAGEMLMHRRKIMPTHMERTIFGNATGNSLVNVVPTAFGNVGQLACWEHVQPLLKYHTITQRETFYVAAWPPVFPIASENELWSMSRDGE
jgi:nitrilase